MAVNKSEFEVDKQTKDFVAFHKMSWICNRALVAKWPFYFFFLVTSFVKALSEWVDELVCIFI